MSEKELVHKEQIRVLVADDHPVVREGLACIIEDSKDMLVAGVAANGHEAVELFSQYKPDITLMDLRMPQMEGVEAITLIRQQSANARIIVLTTYDSDEDIYRALRAGAMAYLLKDTSRQELLNTIRAVHAGQKRISPEMALKLVERLNSPELSAREVEVLRLIVAGKSNSEIGTTLYITEGTVKTHVKTILKKLEASDRTSAATTALKRGLVRLD
ncbi:response regulator [Scytonema sp. NUACC26]|uniref:response regulator n=1 Tax=Scytonema sp. NUACC26 TaxID=3140176 RepID=UPI0034DBBE09